MLDERPLADEDSHASADLPAVSTSSLRAGGLGGGPEANPVFEDGFKGGEEGGIGVNFLKKGHVSTRSMKKAANSLPFAEGAGSGSGDGVSWSGACPQTIDVVRDNVEDAKSMASGPWDDVRSTPPLEPPG